MTLNKPSGLSNKLKYHFYLFKGPGDLLRTSNLLFGLIAFWEQESEKSFHHVSSWAIINKLPFSDSSYIPFAESKIDAESKPESMFLII